MTGFAALKRALRSWPKEGVPTEAMAERPHERLRIALQDLGRTGPADFTTLVRHMLRFEQMHHGGVQRLALLAPSETQLCWHDAHRLDLTHPR